MRPGSTPWFGAALRTREQAREAVELAVTVSGRTLPQLDARLAAACRESGLRVPFTYPERSRLAAYFGLLADAGAPGHGFRERRALRKQARAEWEALRSPDGTGGAAADAERAAAAVRLSGPGPGVAGASRQLSALSAMAPLSGLDEDPVAASAALAADEETPWRLPRLHELARRFGALGLAPVLDEIRLRGRSGPPEP